MHVHMRAFCSDDSGFSVGGLSSGTVIFLGFEERSCIHGISLLTITLHWVPPSLISISDLIGEVGCRENHPKQVNEMTKGTKYKTTQRLVRHYIGESSKDDTFTNIL